MVSKQKRLSKNNVILKVSHLVYLFEENKICKAVLLDMKSRWIKKIERLYKFVNFHGNL